MLTLTAERLLHTRHPRLINTLATVQSLSNAVNHADNKTQHQMNLIGDCLSMETSTMILDTVAEDCDEPLLDLRAGVESLWLGSMAGASLKSRAALARRMGIKGYTFLSDNVGFVRQSLTL